uniref:Uncharacterized protein n=1 Tax=Lotharella oceanica TaxID=641309 RepID=A0A7S2XEZ7_9EUKA|mmetsp:Transcript_3596/g.6971  ORF Transcript_3596/g.6971 Transcript_3596/m.6971 type:complete len:191 (+) Transcript_3596:123-695(+)
MGKSDELPKQTNREIDERKALNIAWATETDKEKEKALKDMEAEESGAVAQESKWTLDKEATKFANELMEAKHEIPSEAYTYVMQQDESAYGKARIALVKIMRLENELFSVVLGQTKEEKVFVHRPTMQQAMDCARKCRQGENGVLMRGPPAIGKSVAIIHASLVEEFDGTKNVVLFSNKVSASLLQFIRV